MSKTKPSEEVRQLIQSLTGQIKTEEDLGELTRQIRKAAIEGALGAELEDHLGYSRHDSAGHHSGNSRNGYSGKTVKG
ncbi:MAG: transposase, partial [Gammaproteobacteria bacterium]